MRVALTDRADAVSRRRNTRRLLGLWMPAGWLTLVALAAVLAPWLPLRDPLEQDLLLMLAPPGEGHWLRSDGLGRDVLSRVVFGLPLALTRSLGSVAVGVLVGGLFGLRGGYYRGSVERWILAANNFLMGCPPLVLVLALMS